MTASRSSLGDKVVFYAPGDIRIEPMYDKPSPGKGEILVRVEACAVCGTDVKSFVHGNPHITPPQTIGHEFCGIIESLGSDVEGYLPGSRVVMATSMGCGTCRFCKEGRSNLCLHLEAIGFYCPGGMAPYLIIPERGVRLRHLVEVGDLDPVVASLAEPMSCVVNDVTRVPREEVENALVLGLGPLGFLHAVCLRDRGIDNIVCVEFPGRRFELAREFGFTVITPDEIDIRYRELSGGLGFDHVIVTAPAASVQEKAPMYARKRGFVSFFASLPQGSEMLNVNSRTIHYGELALYGVSDSTPDHVRQAVKILRSRQNEIRKLITHVLEMKNFIEGLDEIKKGNAVKVVLVPKLGSSTENIEQK